MNDPRPQGWSDSTQPVGGGYPQNTDPAYAGQGYGPTYGQGYTPPSANPTQQLPPYWQQTGYGGYGGSEPPPSPPGGPKSPRWLWILAVAAVLMVTGLVVALVIVTSSSKESTLVAPLPPLSVSSSTSATTPATTSTTRTPTTTAPVLPFPTTTPSISPSATASPTGADDVVYTVSGEGRAINITYVDTGGVMQTEFNVMLPWTKQVSLSAPARGSASVAIVNVGRDVTCSVSVNGAQVRERTGRGLTICTGAG